MDIVKHKQNQLRSDFKAGNRSRRLIVTDAVPSSLVTSSVHTIVVMPVKCITHYMGTLGLTFGIYMHAFDEVKIS